MYVNIEVCFFLYRLAVFGIACVAYGTASQLFTCGLVTCVSTWYGVTACGVTAVE